LSGVCFLFVSLLAAETTRGRLQRYRRFPPRRLDADQLTGRHDILVLPGKSTGVNVLDADWNQICAAPPDY
jgi:hypothetical protein